MEIVAADIGGTHARFAIAVAEDGKVVHLGEPVTLKTADFASLQTAWEAFGRQLGRTLPRAAALAVAAPIAGEVIKFTNNPWIIRPALVGEKLGVDAHVLINDFAAIAHAVAGAGREDFAHLAGPDTDLPDHGVISIVGPGTGLGVAALLRNGVEYHVLPTEGGHVDFAPLDTIEDRILSYLRRRYTRVSVERVVSGPGLAAIYEVLSDIEGRDFAALDDKTLWDLALDGSDSLAAAALDRFCLSLGAVAGDYALVHGAAALVVAGGLGQRIAPTIARSGFAERFIAKGRYQALMAALPVKLITHPQPGLFGAAAAFARDNS